MRHRDAGVVYLVLEGVTALLQATTWTTAAIYFINAAHLGPLQLVLLGTVMEASIFVFEIPPAWWPIPPAGAARSSPAC